MDVKIYDNYGVLAHEKQHVYTTAPEATAAVSEPFYIIIPEGMHPYVTPYGVYEQEVFADEQARRYYPKAASELDRFLRMWSKNILDQGFRTEQAAPPVMTLDEFAATFA